MQFDRTITNDIRAELKKSKQVLVIYGPRQAGKTTLIKELLKSLTIKTKSFNADDYFTRELLTPPALITAKRIVGSAELIVIDEAQRVSDIGLLLKIIIDNFNCKVIVSGSSSFDLSTNISEPLTGRSKTYYLYPLSYNELKTSFDPSFPPIKQLEEMLTFGMYPKVWTLNGKDEKESYLQEYIDKYLYKDILEFSGIRKPKKVIDLLTLLALQIGSEVSIEELGSRLALARPTIESYLDILEKMFVLFNLRGFSRNLRKEVYKNSKYFFWDLGLRNGLIRNFNPLNMRQDIGGLFENFMIMERIKHNTNNKIRANYYFWRTWDQQEIDLIEEKEGKLDGYEFKLRPKRKLVPRSWAKTYPTANYSVVSKDNFANYLVKGLA